MTTSLTFSDLCAACARLSTDPRIEPSTPIVIEGGCGPIWKIEVADLPRRIVILLMP